MFVGGQRRPGARRCPPTEAGGPSDQSRSLTRRPPAATGQVSWLIRSARAKSLAVRPPAECVDSVNVTLFQAMPMSG